MDSVYVHGQGLPDLAEKRRRKPPGNEKKRFLGKLFGFCEMPEKNRNC